MLNRYRQRLLTMVTGLALIAAPALAGAEVPKPAIPQAEGDACVEPTEVMRRDHFKFIMHQRDETVHNGIRTTKHSLKGCIDCHVQPNAGGEYPRVTSEEHFCQTCHAYAAVQIDCFQCHADRPEEVIGRSSARPAHGDVAARGLIAEIAALLKESDSQP